MSLCGAGGGIMRHELGQYVHRQIVVALEPAQEGGPFRFAFGLEIFQKKLAGTHQLQGELGIGLGRLIALQPSW